MTVAVEDLYAEHHRFLWGLCYRMLGSAADAEDIVQDTFVRAMERPPRRTDEPVRPWLVRVALNLSRDFLRRRRRREYIGPWLPSPIDTGDESAPPSHEPAIDGVPIADSSVREARKAVGDRSPYLARRPVPEYDLLESVSFAFLLALEALTPTQRGVLLLRDVFDYSVKETADALDLSEANVKTTHHRARHAMQMYDGRRQIPTADVQDAARTALNEFLRCLTQHDVGGIEALLAEDVRTVTDGGGEFQAALRPVVGRDKVARFYLAVIETARDAVVRMQMLNGTPAVVADLPSPTGRQAPRFTFAVDLNGEGKIADIYVVSATRKLTAIK
jgi:RNA polymerase sigma-70 factor (ECF subfamily)